MTMTREEAQQALNDALTKQREAKARLALVNTALLVEKANVLEADGNVMVARAALARLGGPVVVNNGKGDDQSKVRQAVVAILRGAGPEGLTVDEVFNALCEQGITVGGAKPRQNLNAYISRWSKVGTGIVNVGRGRWGVEGAENPPVRLSTDPHDGDGTDPGEYEVVPAFLAPVEVDYEVEGQPGPPEEVPAEPFTLLPEGFPGRAALTEAGYHTRKDLEGKTHDQLRRIKGVGAQTARDILSALEV